MSASPGQFISWPSNCIPPLASKPAADMVGRRKMGDVMGMVGRIGRIALVLGMATAGAPAQAAWLKATSTHFVVYSDSNVEKLRAETAELERFDLLMSAFSQRFLTDVTDASRNPDRAFNKVTVYVLPSVAAVQQFARMKEVAGFYMPRVTGSVAFTPRQSDSVGENALSPRIVLFHEYTHHFLLGNSTLALPAWFSEGFAEFASTTAKRDDRYWIGVPAQHRAYGLLEMNKQLTMGQLFAPPASMTSEQTEAIYGRGWLLTHMVMFDPVLRTQLGKYLTLLNSGTKSAAAAQQSFGDLKALDKRADAYLKQSRVSALPVSASILPQPVVEVRALTDGEAALIRMRMESTRGVDGRTAKPLWAKAKEAGARYPADPVAQGWLAEMAYDAGDLEAAEVAADHAIAADPTSSQGLLYKARVHLARLVIGKSHDEAAWKEARSWIIKANRAQNNDAAALALFYQSFQMQDAKPNKGAVAGLYRAVELVPQDMGLRFQAARQRLLDEDVPGAKALLRPLAYNPHAGSDNPAARILAALDAGAGGRAALDALKEKSSELNKDESKGGGKDGD